LDGETRKTYRIFVGKHTEKQPLGSQRTIWKDNMNLNFWETRCKDLNVNGTSKIS
jgi:hypothetical protein